MIFNGIEMKVLLPYLSIFFTNTVFSQSICEGKIVVPTVTINHCDSVNWDLIFEDNFDEAQLDSNKWSIISGVIRDPYFDNSKAWLETENVEIINGTLNIFTQKEELNEVEYSVWVENGAENFENDFEYTTGEIWSKESFSFGRFEAKLKIPKGLGFWPAFWIYGENPRYCEIDVFEFVGGKTNDQNMNIHFDHDGDGERQSCQLDSKGKDYSEEFHTFTLLWEPHKITWLVDGEVKRVDYKYYTLLGQPIECEVEAWKPVIMNLIFPADPMFIILNTAVQNGPNTPDSTTPFPGIFQVDWVKYYKRL